MKKTNPINAQVQPLAGRQLPPKWQAESINYGGTYDRRNLSEMWKNPQWSSKLSGDNIDSIVRNSRLSSTVASGV